METTKKAPAWFWVVSGISLVWNLMGVWSYLAQVSLSEEALAAMPEARRTLLETVPAWATAAFAIAVFAGALGCLFLLLKKSWSIHILAISLVAVVVQMFHAYIISNAWEVLGPMGAVMPLMVIIVASFLVWFGRFSKKNGWLS